MAKTARRIGKLIREMEGQLRGLPDYYEYFAGAADKLHGDTIPADKVRLFFRMWPAQQTNAAYDSNGKAFTDVRKSFAFGVNPTGWGDSWVDLRNSGTNELVVANGGIPITNLRKDAVRPMVLAPKDGRFVDSGLLRSLAVNGRGVAAADYDNDGRVDLAVGTIGGPLLLLHNTSPSGNWLEVQVEPFSPGAVVTVVDSRGDRQVRAVQAGSSYLSSEDPRVHFGFGKATVKQLTVRYPDGTIKQVDRPATNRLVTVKR